MPSRRKSPTVRRSPTVRSSPTVRKSPRKTKERPNYYGGGKGNEDDSGDRDGSLIAVRKKVSRQLSKTTGNVGYKKSLRESQAPTRKTSTDGLLESSESEFEDKSESGSESESDDERREGRRASASQGGNNKKASDYAKGTPRENEGRHVVGTRNSDAQEQGSDGTPSDDSRVLGTRKSSNQEEQGRANTHGSVKAGGRLNHASRNGGNDSPSGTDEDRHDEGSRTRHIHKGLQRRMFQREEVGQDEDSDGEDEQVDLKRQVRMMDRTIRELKRKNESLELRLDRETKMSRTNKSMLSGQEMNFVKDVNDFCKEKLFPREKFLRNNWQDYLPNDRRSFYRLCMDNLSIPEGSDPKDIWGRVVVPAVRDKYQSLKCNLNNKIKSVYMGMKMLQKCR